jgi:hypothetical protein
MAGVRIFSNITGRDPVLPGDARAVEEGYYTGCCLKFKIVLSSLPPDSYQGD